MGMRVQSQTARRSKESALMSEEPDEDVRTRTRTRTHTHTRTRTRTRTRTCSLPFLCSLRSHAC